MTDLLLLARQLFAVALTGALVGAIYVGFTSVVEYLQHWLWFEIGQVDVIHWHTIPIAIVGAVALSCALKYWPQKDDVPHTIPALMASSNITWSWLVLSLIIGGLSLVAGAGLGPEIILLPVSFGVGYLLALALKLPEPSKVGLAGILALLAAFFNAPAAALLPLFFALINKLKTILGIFQGMVVGFLAVMSSIVVLRLLNESEGYVVIDPIPFDLYTPQIFFLTFVLSALATFLPTLFALSVSYTKKLVNNLPSGTLSRGVIAGLVVGVFYAILGPLSFFSGHDALHVLAHDAESLSNGQLLALGIGKFVIAVWSVATIYRGGVIFPQLVTAVSLGLVLISFTSVAYLLPLFVAVFVGVFAGAMGSVIIAASFALSVFGFGVWPLLLVAIGGSLSFQYMTKKYYPKMLVASH